MVTYTEQTREVRDPDTGDVSTEATGVFTGEDSGRDIVLRTKTQGQAVRTFYLIQSAGTDLASGNCSTRQAAEAAVVAELEALGS